MNKVRFLKKITLAASVLLAITFTFGCSSDDDKGSFGSCSEAVKADETCRQDYSVCGSKPGSELDACEYELDGKTEKCLLDSGICGNASFNECRFHFINECEEL